MIPILSALVTLDLKFQRILISQLNLDLISVGILRNNQSINDIKKSYEIRSISLYKNRNNDLSNYIFNSKSFSQMIYRLKYFNIISEINQNSVNKIKNIASKNNFIPLIRSTSHLETLLVFHHALQTTSHQPKKF